MSRETAHYLTRVMRTKTAIVFGDGLEFYANIDEVGKNIIVGKNTGRADPSNDITLYFAPIKRTDDLINMATQMGVKKLVPVITEHTVAQHDDNSARGYTLDEPHLSFQKPRKEGKETLVQRDQRELLRQRQELRQHGR